MKGLLTTGCLLLALLLAAFGVQASCGFSSGVSSEVPGYLSFGNVAVQRDVPVGSVIATATTGAYNGGNNIAGCSEAWTYRWELSKWGTLSTLGGNIYNTNVPGVGIRLTNSSSGKVLPYDQSVGANTYIFIGGNGIKAELIKTGDITGGTLDTGMLARASVANQFYFANATLNGTNTITSESCSVTTNPVNVPLGDHDKSEFSGPGSATAWQTFNINLSCVQGARINVRIDATSDSDAGVPGVIKLDSDPVNASGVGVQLWYRYEDSPVQFGQERYYYTSPSGGNENVQLQARYYQTTQSVTAGKANATATFTLTYK
ncbi:fimbrial protein [Enterobacter hormaechei]|uniref:fimbrial protein n=1 Tax=Enterobacteriaceae TaxID=543 RepID=UPI002B37F020|nr:fimbrial protein [Citrobacter portucalensis]MCE1950013.1 fimbrial protein [Enterobacter hormaechei]MCE1963011.1 fimbrial protein [Enterobacter hormaechei]MCM7815109.1 fimbrial protein [Enterobacter hormaechei]MEB2766474.1 fimbrial protein [Citrobacter portucalensis]